ncbi:hypothetical protein D3C80_1314960 [compost metagenome]
MQDVIVVIGWLFFLLGGGAFTLAGVVILFLGNAFSGRFSAECLIPFVIGGLLLWGAYESNPFVVALK